MTAHTHIVQYYETDKMGITHHSNYIRWMEEARCTFLDSIGFGYDKLEESGIASPVIAVNCTYHTPTTFHDVIEIHVKISSFTGVRLIVSYEMIRQCDGATVATGESQHCFLNSQNRPISLKKYQPTLYAVLYRLADEHKN